MAAVDATAVSPEELQAKAWEGFAEGNWQKDMMSVTLFRRTTRLMRATSPSWLTPLRRPSTCAVSR